MSMKELGWDAKCAGVQVFVAKMLMQGKGGRHASVFQQYEQMVEFFMCPCLEKGIRGIQKTLGGLLCGQRWNNM